MVKFNVIQVLRQRGLIEMMTDPLLEELCQTPLTLYIGFDPTADSLHLGSLLPLIILKWFQDAGHHVIALVGGATGMIGDPSGRSSERNLLDESTIHNNLIGIEGSIRQVLGAKSEFRVVNNLDWIGKFSFIDFLRDIGKHFRLGTMLSKESVKLRVESEEGMSFTEFSYQLLQGYDFLHLYQTHGVVLQMGGSDQWGNITAGIELIRRQLQEPAYGLTFPLITKSDGKKFGKSEKGAIWLSPERLSVFEFYQYFFTLSDVDGLSLLSRLTFLPLEKIKELQEAHGRGALEPHTIQKLLAQEVTRIVHGEEGVILAEKITKESIARDQPITRSRLEAMAEAIKTIDRRDLVGNKLIDLAVEGGLIASKGEYRRTLKNGGIFLNQVTVLEDDYIVRQEDLIEGYGLLLTMGKKNRLIYRM